MSDSLDNIRDHIDALDNRLVELLAQRMQYIPKAGEYKRAHNLPALDEVRWQQATEIRLKQARSLGLSEELVAELYELIHKYTLQIERDLGVR